MEERFVDFEEQRDGMLTGKAAALADWRFRKEQRDFDRLCRRLYARNWARKRRRDDPERARSALRSWRSRNRERVRATDRARRARKRKPIRLTCKQCASAFSPKRFRCAKWCSKKCANQWYGSRRKPRNRGIRNMQIQQTILSVLRATPWLTLAEVRARATGCKAGSVASKLTELCKAGTVAHDGRKKGRRYALPDRATGAA